MSSGFTGRRCLVGDDNRIEGTYDARQNIQQCLEDKDKGYHLLASDLYVGEWMPDGDKIVLHFGNRKN